ncbi:radical SAM protein [Candidatus Nomurabacteria bacterium]|nr:radical SAM protein [Candidatus Nomurabacteria bacterium]
MSFEKKPFENAGLKIEGDRVLTYSKLSCPLDCTYCFVDDMNFNQERGVAYLSQEQYDLLNRLPKEVKTIMLGCDTEFFQQKEEAIQILENLAEQGRDLSVVTKLPLSKEYIQRMRDVSDEVSKNGNVFTFSVSLPCINSSLVWEPKVPSPEKRINTLKEVYESDIKTLLALRPLLPTVSDEELEDIIFQTKDYQYGYYSGPLYLKSLDHPSIQNVPDLMIEEVQPHWMPEGNIFFKVERKGQMETLAEIVESHGQRLYTGAADAINHLRRP